MAVLNNAIAFAQFRLLGGWKNLLLTSGAYAIILAAVMFGLVYGLRAPASNTYAGMLVLFFILQFLLLLLYGVARVAQAARSDVRSHIIESHRMMPVGPLAAVLGYWLGPEFQAFVLFAINLGLGAVAVAGAGLAMQSWLIANGVLLAFSLFVWAIVLFFSFRSGLALWIAIVAMLAVPLSEFQVLDLVPGANVLASPLIGHTIFDLRTTLTLDWPFAVAGIVQAVIAALYLLAAARRYERDDAVGFKPLLGLLLLIAWVTASIIGAAARDQFHPFRRMWNRPDPETAFSVTFTLTLLLGLLPVASAARLHDRKAAGAKSRSLGPMPVVLLAAAASLLVIYPMAFHPTPAQVRAIVRTALTTIAFLATARYLLGIAHRRGWRPRISMLAWILLTWCIPLLIEAVLAALSADPENRHMSQIAMFSPPVEVMQAWTWVPMIHSERLGGLLAQCAAAVGMWALYRVQLQRGARGTAKDSRGVGPHTALSPPPVAPAGPAGPMPVAPAAQR
jgi:hypothetical protein